MTKEIPSERSEQIKLHYWCRIKKLNSFAIPNGGTRHKLEAVNLKKEGVTVGVSDYCVILPHSVLFIEMKRRKKKLKSGKFSNAHSKPSDEQLEFIEKANRSSAVVATVAYGFDEAKAFIEENMKKYDNLKHFS